MGNLIADTIIRLRRAQESARLIDEMAGRSLAILEESHGLLTLVHGVPCHEVVRQYSGVCASEAAKVKATLDMAVHKLNEVVGVHPT